MLKSFFAPDVFSPDGSINDKSTRFQQNRQPGVIFRPSAKIQIWRMLVLPGPQISDLGFRLEAVLSVYLRFWRQGPVFLTDSGPCRPYNQSRTCSGPRSQSELSGSGGPQHFCDLLFDFKQNLERFGGVSWIGPYIFGNLPPIPATNTYTRCNFCTLSGDFFKELRKNGQNM